jgi:hypothetical protein
MTDPSQATGPHRVAGEDIMRRWRKRRRRIRRWIRRGRDGVLVLLVVAVVVIALQKTTSKGSRAPGTTTATGVDATHPPAADVKLTGCGYADYAATAKLTVTNHLDKEQNYYVEVTFKDNGIYFTSAIASSPHLPAKQTVKVVASNLTTSNPPTKLTCKVTRIERFG